MEYRYIVKRFEKSSTGIIIAFTVSTKTGASKYFETSVSSEDCLEKSDNEICCVAYYQLKAKIEEGMLEFKEEAPTVLGADFIPPDTEGGYEFDI